jgi:hypothetical protein
MKKLSDAGISMSLAQHFASAAANYLHRVPEDQEFNFYFTPKGEVMFPELTEGSVPTDAFWRLTIYPLQTVLESFNRLWGTELRKKGKKPKSPKQ